MQQQVRRGLGAKAKIIGSKIVNTVPVVCWPTARQLNVFSPSSQMTAATISALATRLESYKSNESVAVAAFSSNGSDIFSRHLPQDQKTVIAMNKLSNDILTYPKDTMVFLENNIKSSTLGVFSQTQVLFICGILCYYYDFFYYVNSFDLATHRRHSHWTICLRTVFQSEEEFPHFWLALALRECRYVFLCHSMSFRLWVNIICKQFARYAVAAKLTLSAADMHQLGYITHILPENSMDIILPALADIFDSL